MRPHPREDGVAPRLVGLLGGGLVVGLELLFGYLLGGPTPRAALSGAGEAAAAAFLVGAGTALLRRRWLMGAAPARESIRVGVLVAVIPTVALVVATGLDLPAPVSTPRGLFALQLVVLSGYVGTALPAFLGSLLALLAAPSVR